MFEELGPNLSFAALAHDMGTPPFSHASEYFQIKLQGTDHEQFVKDIIDGSEFEREVRRQGGDIDLILKLVTGEIKPFSDLINGSIDLDNLDNTLRYAISMGLMTGRFYSPEALAAAFTRNGEGLAFSQEAVWHLQGWEQTRTETYKFVYGEGNLSTGMIIFRALDFAQRECELPREYFTMTDAEAFVYLSQNCNPETRLLMERANRWQGYPQVFNETFTDVPEELKEYIMDSDNRVF